MSPPKAVPPPSTSGTASAAASPAPAPRTRRSAPRGGLVARAAASALLALLAIEVVLRFAGVRPKERPSANQNEPILHAADPVLGWTPIPGRYTIPPWAPNAPAVAVSIWPDGSRASAPAPPVAGPEVVFVGCSFTFGWGISDDETLVWRLQARHPELHLGNHAVKAYGTYQALLQLEQMFARGERPARVVYGFHESHEERNVAAPHWLAMLERFSRKGGVALPYVTASDDGTLVRHPPERYPTWPLRETLAISAYLEDLAVRRSESRVKHMRQVTESLLLAMRDLCVRHGVAFDVVLLKASPRLRNQYSSFLRRNGIPFADCVVPIPAHLRVPGEGHPGGEINAQWARCVEQKLFTRPS